jgi:hypothetical protein
MVEFGDNQIAAILYADHGQNFDDYYDHETYERLSELFSIIEEGGHSTEYPQGEHNLKGALAGLNEQLLGKRDVKDRSKKYKLAAARLANSMIREALNGFNNRADRMLDTAAAAWGTTAFKLGRRKKLVKPAKKSKVFTLNLDVSEANDFLNKVRGLGSSLSKSKGKIDNKIFANHAALSAAKQAVSDVLVDVYINKNKQDDSSDDEDLRKISTGIRYLMDCINLLSFLDEMLTRKTKEINLMRSNAALLINTIQPITFYFRNLSVQVQGLIEQTESFVRSPDKGSLSSIYSQVSQMANENRMKGAELMRSMSDLADKSFLKTQWPDRRVRFSNDLSFNKNLFGDINYYLDKVVVKINMSLDTPFSKISGLIDSTYKSSNPDYSGSMSYGQPHSVNYSAAGVSPTVEIEASRLINKRITKDKDILEVLYSVTDNLSLVFDDDELKAHDIDLIRDAIGEAMFNRAGLETEVSNFIEKEMNNEWNRAIL